MQGDLDRIVYTREQIEERVKELAAQVVGVFRDKPFVAAVVLKGAFIFAADLVRHLPEPLEIVFVRCRSYGNGTEPAGPPAVELPADFSWEGKDVLLIEDIVDTGETVESLRAAIERAGAKTVRICAFLDKPARRRRDCELEFVGFTLQDEGFVVGYGLDHAERYRQLPYVGALRRPPA